MVVDGDSFVYMEVSCMERASICTYFIVSYIERRRLVVLKDHMGVERDPNLEVNKDIFIFDDRGKHKRGIIEEKFDYKGKVHSLGWELNKQEK